MALTGVNVWLDQGSRDGPEREGGGIYEGWMYIFNNKVAREYNKGLGFGEAEG